MLLQTWRLIARAVERPTPARIEPLVLTASEVGYFVFCPEAWYLQRRGARQAAFAEKRLQIGIRAHRQIGRETDRVREVETARLVLLIVMLILAILLFVQFAGPTSVPHP
jgi:hypothetical protein